jgi:predicted PhzF superfamily epimerase YddE/YHI9
MMPNGCHGLGGGSDPLPSPPMSGQPRQTAVRVLRVFTRDGQGGNHLAVHEGLLLDAEMQAVATALGYSETIFVDQPADDGAIPVRIFTPASELPFAGHPLVGATWHLAPLGGTARLRCGVGVVVGHRPDAGTAHIEVAYQPTVKTAVLGGAVASWDVRMPLRYEVVQLASPADVAGYTLVDRPDHRLVWARGDEGDGNTIRARFFAPGMGVDEDPATGSAAVALAAVQRHGGIASGALTIRQGAEIGFPSRIELTWSREATEIGGSVEDDGWRTISVPPGS